MTSNITSSPHSPQRVSAPTTAPNKTEGTLSNGLPLVSSFSTIKSEGDLIAQLQGLTWPDLRP